MANNFTDIIDTKDPGIVVKETSIKLSDEKFKNALSRTYEKAQSDASAIKFRKYYGVFLSIAGTLLLSLLTANFGSVGNISSARVTSIAWGIFIGSTVLGFVLMAMSVCDKMKTDTALRDDAVNKIFTEFVPKSDS